MKTSELTGPALDWAVAKCEGLHWEAGDIFAGVYGPGFAPATEWAHDGPIIEREKITTEWTGEDWMAYIKHDDEFFGPTPLVAAMRCYVASKLGDTVDVPDQLCEQTKGESK